MLALMLLAVLAIYLAFAVVITRWLTGLPRFARHRALVGALCVLAFVLIPTWDEIAGRIYFHHLCETEGGVRIYKVVELGPEYWNADGTPRFITEEDYLTRKVFEGQYVRQSRFIENYGDPFRIVLDEDLVVDVRKNQILGKKTSFIYFGGWVLNNSGFHVSGSRCHSYSDTPYIQFITQIFKQK